MGHRLFFAGLTVFALGCEQNHNTGENTVEIATQLAEDASISSAESSRMQGLTHVVLTPLNRQNAIAGNPSDEVPSAAIDAVVTKSKTHPNYWPRGCATATKDPTKKGHVTVQFDHCNGADKLKNLTGSIDAYIKRYGGGLHVEIVSTDSLKSDGAPLEYKAQIDVMYDEDTRQTIWHQTWKTTDEDRVVSHASSQSMLYSFDQDTFEICVNASGVSHTTIQDDSGTITRSIETVLDGFQRCSEQCPTAGSITTTGRKNRQSVVISFDGTDKATVTGPRGKTFALPLPCEE